MEFVIRKLVDDDYESYVALIHQQTKIFGVDRPSHWKRIEASADRFLFGELHTTLGVFHAGNLLCAATMEWWNAQPIWMLGNVMADRTHMRGLSSPLRKVVVPKCMNACRTSAEQAGYFEYVFCVAADRYKKALTLYGEDRDDYNRYSYVTEAVIAPGGRARFSYQRGIMGNVRWPVAVAIRRASLRQEFRNEIDPALHITG